ncbi:MAG: serine hydrolase [bacterium]
MRSSFFRCLTAIFVILIFSTALQAQTPVSNAQIKTILQQRIDTAQQSVGIVVGVIDESGSRVIGHGTLAKNSDRPVDGGTIYEIGSITKVFTALLLADMVERGELDLHDSIERYLPAGLPTPKRDGKAITLFHLTTHTSGLPRLPDNLRPQDPTNPYADYSNEQMLDFLRRYELPREIGARYEYSNFGVGLLGYLLARKAGLSYEELVVARICLPLGLPDTRINLTAEQRPRLATGHNAGGEAVANWDIPTLAGAGALRSTADDLLLFLAANLGLTTSRLTPAMQRMQQKWQSTGSPDMQIGLGWHLLTRHGTRLIWHNGGTGGYHSFIGFDNDHKRGVVVLANSAYDIDDIGFHILNPEFPLKEVKPPRQAVTVDSEIYADYVGEYELTPQVIFTITTKEQKLFAKLTGQDTYPIYPESETKFFYKVVDAQITFVRNAEGKVTHLILHQNGVDQQANKRRKAGVSLQEAPKEIKLETGLMQRYVGEYELQPGFVFTVTLESDGLMVQATGQPKVPVYAESTTRFFYKVVNAKIEFKLDAKGEVEGLTLFQAGREMYAAKN